MRQFHLHLALKHQIHVPSIFYNMIPFNIMDCSVQNSMALHLSSGTTGSITQQKFPNKTKYQMRMEN